MDSANPLERVLSGSVVSGGMAAGNAHIFINTNIHSAIDSDEMAETFDDGWSRIEQAIADELQRLEQKIHRGAYAPDSSVFSLFDTYRAFLRDPSLHADMRDELRENGGCAAAAVRSSCRKWATGFGQVTNGQLQPKALLVSDIGKILIEALAVTRSSTKLIHAEPHILVVDHLFVSDVVALHRLRPTAIVVQHGHPASHGLILARELEIPILCQVPDATRLIPKGTPLIVDAERSRIIVHPSRTIEAYRQSAETLPVVPESEVSASMDICGTPVRVMADVGCVATATQALEAGADGIGLLRMESLYMQADQALRVDEMVRCLSDILAPMAGKPVIARLLDAGGDKPLPYLKDDSMGYRGVRLLARHPELLQPQLQALLKLSRGYKQLHILVPMVTVAEDMQLIREALENEARQEGVAPPPLGAMIETPAAALMIDELWAWCDFIRIGSNDLTQYVMAAPRASLSTNRYFQPAHPAVLKLIGKICRSEDASLIGLCGSLADQVGIVPQLLQLGIREFTVPPRSVQAIKRAVSDYACGQRTLRSCNDPESIRQDGLV